MDDHLGGEDLSYVDKGVIADYGGGKLTNVFCLANHFDCVGLGHWPHLRNYVFLSCVAEDLDIVIWDLSIEDDPLLLVVGVDDFIENT